MAEAKVESQRKELKELNDNSIRAAEYLHRIVGVNRGHIKEHGQGEEIVEPEVADHIEWIHHVH